MKNKNILVVGTSVFFVAILAALQLTQSSKCDIGSAAPAFEYISKHDTTLGFNTRNISGRKVMVVLSRKDSKGRLEPIQCQLLSPNQCGTIDYKAKAGEKLYISYRRKDWAGIFYFPADHFEEEEVEECSATPTIGIKALKRGVSGSNGGTGTATTTVDEK